MLTGKQRHFLRGLGHGLKPVVLVGRGGIDDGLVAAVNAALLDHELIKMKLGDTAELDRHEAADAIAAKTKSEVAQVLGHMVLLYRPHPAEPAIVLPDGKGGKGSAGVKPATPAPPARPTAKAKPRRQTKPKSPRDRRRD